MFWVQPVIPNANRFDSVDNNQNFAGAWATYRPKQGQAIDLYYLMLDNTSRITQIGIPRGTSRATPSAAATSGTWITCCSIPKRRSNSAARTGAMCSPR